MFEPFYLWGATKTSSPPKILSPQTCHLPGWTILKSCLTRFKTYKQQGQLSFSTRWRSGLNSARLIEEDEVSEEVCIKASISALMQPIWAQQAIFSLSCQPLCVHPFPFNPYDDILNIQAQFKNSFCVAWLVLTWSCVLYSYRGRWWCILGQAQEAAAAENRWMFVSNVHWHGSAL